jgi:hypothetical protein
MVDRSDPSLDSLNTHNETLPSFKDFDPRVNDFVAEIGEDTDEPREVYVDNPPEEVAMTRGQPEANTGTPVIVAEGKTKIIWKVDAGEVLIESKDDITAGDGVRRDVIEGKAALATTTTTNCFKLLQQAGIPTHFIRQESERTFRAQEVAMIPVEVVVRRIPFGSYLRRHPAAEPLTPFADLKVEMFSKDDGNHDPLLTYDFEDGTVTRHVASAPPSGETVIDTLPIHESPFGLTEE